MMLRRADPDDVAGMHRVRLAVRENVLASSSVTPAAYLARLEEEGRSWVVAEGPDVVAFAVAENDGRIWALFVDPEHEGRGHGRALHEIMLAWLHDRGLARAVLATEPATRAERFYRRLGWRFTGLLANGEAAFEYDLRARPDLGR